MEYILYRTDGTHEIIKSEKPLEYEKLRECVGGLIEFAHNFRDNHDGSTLMVNEEGLLNGSKPNPFFTPQYQSHFCGDILQGMERHGDEGTEFIGFDDATPHIRKAKQISPLLFEEGRVFTIFGISDFLANTTRGELRATGERMRGTEPVFKEAKKGARKRFGLRNIRGEDVLIFEGIGKDIPFGLDRDIVNPPSAGGFTSTTMRGNAMLNFSGDIAVIREWVEKKNLNPWFTKYDHVNHVAQDNETETLVFLDFFPTSRSVEQRQAKQMERIRKGEKLGVTTGLK